MRQFVLVCVVMILGLTGIAKAEDFALRDGDTVVFLGDSITAARVYSRMVENYTLLRFPQRKVHFFNAGIGGDTAAGGLARLERDVFSQKATVLIVAFGVNDIGWGMHADEQHKKRYLDSIGEIVRQSRDRGIRVYICSAAVTASDPAKSENDYLQTMCDEGMALARKNGGQSIDVQRSMREVLKRVWKANESISDPAKKEAMHTSDGIHLNELGQTAMAFAILKGLNAPADVSSITIDARNKKVVSSKGCAVSELSATADRLEFTRLDEGLPLNGQTFFALQFRFVPIDGELNRYLVQVKSLPAGRYRLIVDGRKLAEYSSEDLERGINISSVTPDPWQPGGPWDAQANLLYSLTESRDRLQFSVSAPMTEQGLNAGVTDQFRAQTAATLTQLEELQRKVAEPRRYRFALQKIDPKDPDKLTKN